MRTELPPHEKVRFRRGDIADLDALPSAVAPATPSQWRKAPRYAARAAGALLVAITVLGCVFYAIIASGVGEERLRIEAQAAVAALAGDEMETRVGGTRVSFDGLRMLALEVRDARMALAQTGEEIVHVGYVRFGLRFAPLMRGEIRLGGVRLGDARVELDALPGGGDGVVPPFLDEEGIVDPDAAVAAVFDAVRYLVAMLDGRNIDRVTLDNVEIVLPGADETNIVRVASAVVERRPGQKLSLKGNVEFAGRSATLEGEATSRRGSGRIEALAFSLDAPAIVMNGDAEAPAGHRIGDIALALEGGEGGDGGEGARIFLSARLDDSTFMFPVRNRPPDLVPLRAELTATAQEGAGKLEINGLRIASGRSRWNFHGAIGPLPDAGAQAQEPGYRFELVSDGSVAAPSGSPEPSLPLVARIAGHLDASAQLLTIDEIAARSSQSEVHGTAMVRFEPGLVPGVELALEVARPMPVGQIKQLWPWFAARPVRAWVFANVYGGHVEAGNIGFRVEPGRIGDGLPLGPEEVWGSFALQGTRFDVAGRIPPVRDGNGAVVFRGRDVDITLGSGTVFMSGGRTVDARNGLLTIRNAHLRPVIGRLDIDVEGAADAILQLASYDPIDVGRFVDLKPQDLSGKVKGKVVADIPLQGGVPLDQLDWHVALDYEDVDVASPLQGHVVANATGSIEVGPDKAVIEARALLSGAQATLRLIEPLGRGAVERQRHISLQLDDAGRKAIASGLDTLLSGVTVLDVDESNQGRRLVTADLARATLSVPWAGWSKGSGVPARASFTMTGNGNRVELSDFTLQGETFGAKGAISLVNGSLSGMRLSSARLNRGDDFSVDVKAAGRGHDVTIRGNRIDVRSLIKLYVAGAGSAGGTGEGGPVRIDLEVAAMTGFHGEALQNVRLIYSGKGGRTDHMEFSAVTGSGRQVTFTDGRNEGTRTLAMRSTDAGALLRFLDIYERMEGGNIDLALAASDDGPLRGRVDARNFWIVNEPRLGSIVSTPSGGRTLNQAVRGEIDTSRVQFERGSAHIVKGDGYLELDRGVLRGPLIGTTFQGTLYDRQGNMAMTGTFMPAYGVNRIFGEIPLIGQILGNGRDRGLIGITFRLSGKAGEPQLQVNPLSLIAPGIFRSVFEFR